MQKLEVFMENFAQYLSSILLNYIVFNTKLHN